MKHKIYTIWTSDQMRRIWTENMRIIYNDKKRYICFDKEILLRLFFIVCSDWMSKRWESIIVLWHMNHKDKEKHEIDRNHNFNFD